MPDRFSLLGIGPLRSWLPSQCQVCGIWPAHPLGQPICQECLAEFASAVPRCPTCALPLGPERQPCGECMNRPAGLTHCVAAVDYGFPWNRLIARFKFQGDTAWAHLFATLMAQAPGGAELLGDCDALVPLPLTPRRLGERGYNQSMLLTKALANLGPAGPRRVRATWLLKLKDTPAQHTLDRAARLSNLQSAFVVPPDVRDQVSHRRVLLVDDILTTGATLRAAARALTIAGAAEVNALVFARTPSA